MENYEKLANDLKTKVQETFLRLHDALNYREKQIIRQIDVLLLQQQNNALDLGKTHSKLFDINNESEKSLSSVIMKFGELDLSNVTLDSNLYVIEDYITPNIDHECMYKCLDTLNILSSTEDLKVQVEFPQCKYLNLDSDTQDKNKKNIICNVSKENEENLNDLIEGEKSNIKNNLTDNDFFQLNEKIFTSCSPTNKEDLKHQPTQVQYWLNQIISETEIEPVQNTEKQLVES